MLRGRKSTIPQQTIAEIVHLTRYSTPDGQTHWSCRTMAAKAGRPRRRCSGCGPRARLKPHLVDTFKLSDDPKFEEKPIDVVGLYLNPPEKAIVLCMDEKSPTGIGPDPAVAAHEAGAGAFQLHFTQASSSRLNLVERWFRELTDKPLPRRVPLRTRPHRQDRGLHRRAQRDPKLFVWTATTQDILAKVARGRAALQAVNQ